MYWRRMAFQFAYFNSNPSNKFRWPKFFTCRRHYNNNNMRLFIIRLPYLINASGLAITLRLATIQPIKIVNNEDESDEEIRLPKRLRRFRKFASIEYDGEIFMTPQDFLDSLTLDEPRERVFRTVINDKQLKKMLSMTPPLRRGSHMMFRDLGENGIISYAEYLFVVTLLTKSQYSFNIAFIMFDEDDNMQIDKDEFLKILYMIISGNRPPRVSDKDEEQYNQDLDSRECRLDVDFNHIFYGDLAPQSMNLPVDDEEDEFEHLISSSVVRAKRRLKRGKDSQKVIRSTTDPLRMSMEDATNRMKKHDTTLTIHLFGRSGFDSLSFDQFQMFYDRLQKELIEIEFKEFSRGKDRISAVDFARLVLRYSIIHKEEQSPYIRRVYERTEYDEDGISLQQFETFSSFINNLEDFSKAVRLYAVADIPVSRDEFIRAVKCSTGFSLHPKLVDVLYKIFDANQDDKLSYGEFIAVMTDRLNRGFKSQRQICNGWRPFRDCVKYELSGFT